MENLGYAWVILGKLGYACVRMGKLLIRMDNLGEIMDMLACAWGILGNLDIGVKRGAAPDCPVSLLFFNIAYSLYCGQYTNSKSSTYMVEPSPPMK